MAPRFEHTDKNVTPIETSNAREIAELRRDGGWKEVTAKSADVREADTNSPAAVVPAPKAPKK